VGDSLGGFAGDGVDFDYSCYGERESGRR